MEKKEKTMETAANEVAEVVEEATVDKESGELFSTGDDLVEEVDYEGGTGVTREGDETVYKDLGLNVQRIEYMKGVEKRNRFRVAFMHVIEGKKMVMEINLTPTNVKSKMLHQVIGAIFGDKLKMPLEIVKTVTERNDKKTTRYACAISYTGADGIPIRFTFSTPNAEDRMAFEVLRERLIAAGRLK